jgi:hypothetical protein
MRGDIRGDAGVFEEEVLLWRGLLIYTWALSEASSWIEAALRFCCGESLTEGKASSQVAA